MNFVFVFMFDLFIVFCEAILPCFGKKKKKVSDLSLCYFVAQDVPRKYFLVNYTTSNSLNS